MADWWEVVAEATDLDAVGKAFVSHFSPYERLAADVLEDCPESSVSSKKEEPSILNTVSKSGVQALESGIRVRLLEASIITINRTLW